MIKTIAIAVALLGTSRAFGQGISLSKNPCYFSGTVFKCFVPGTFTMSAGTLSGTTVVTGLLDATTGTGIKLPTTSTGGTAQNLGRYETGTFTASLTGARTSSVTITFTAIGNTVTLRWADDVASGTNCAASPFNSGTTDVPAGLRPTITLNGILYVKNNGAAVDTPGEMSVTSGGQLQFNKALSNGNFTAGATCGYYAGTFTYPTN